MLWLTNERTNTIARHKILSIMPAIFSTSRDVRADISVVKQGIIENGVLRKLPGIRYAVKYRQLAEGTHRNDKDLLKSVKKRYATSRRYNHRSFSSVRANHIRKNTHGSRIVGVFVSSPGA